MLKHLEVIENPEFKHEDMISDFSYVVDENKHDNSQNNIAAQSKGLDPKKIDEECENVDESADDSHGWLKDHISVSPGTKDRMHKDSPL